MRTYTRYLAFALAMVLLLMVGCTPSIPENDVEPEVIVPDEPNVQTISGTYQGASFGAKGDIEVAVTLENGIITEIKKISCGDTPFIGDLAIDTVAHNIINNQSLLVDTLSGATLSSYAVISAVTAALEEAGIDISKMHTSAENSSPAEVTDEAYDVVIIGAGPAGLTAALSVYTDAKFEENSGLNVLVKDQLAYAGGSMRFSAGCIAAFNGTQINELTGVSVSPQAIADSWASNSSGGVFNETLAYNALENAGGTLTALAARGFHFDPEKNMTSRIPSTSAEATEGLLYYPVYTAASEETGTSTYSNGYMENAGSPWLAQTLATLVQNAGVEVKLNTKADSLIIEDGVCKGVKVTGLDSSYKVSAKKVIIATGSTDLSAQTRQQFYPELEGVVWFGLPHANGDAQKWITEMGGRVALGSPSLTLGYNGIIGYFGEESFLYSQFNTVWVNSHGKRFFDEGGSRTASALMAQDEHYAYVIFDASHDGVKFMDTLTRYNLAWSANSIAELAAQIGVPVNALEETIMTYNADYEAGSDSVFGTTLEKMSPVLEGPYYAAKVSVVMSEGPGSILVNDNCQVLLNEGAEPIENLYACGSVISNSFSKYGLGAGNMMALATGAYVGDIVRLTLTNEG